MIVMDYWAKHRKPGAGNTACSYHQLAQRQADFYRSGGASLSREEAQVLRILKAENQRLEHALERKERALAEAAALLVSQKNYRALLRSKAE